MLSVTQLAKRYGLSRSTILYYEKEGLLAASLRDQNGYRWYDKDKIETLAAIHSYRSFGLPISKIKPLLAHKDNIQEAVLKQHFFELESEIENLRQQQQAIVAALKQPELLEEKTVTKQRWVQIMSEAGMSEQDMRNWHKKFEELEPEEHEKFLQSLGIESDERARIRQF